MKTKPIVYPSKFRSKVTVADAVLPLTIGISLLALASEASNIVWQGGTASYNTPADWVGGAVPGPANNAVNDNGSGNVVQINPGDPDWTVNQILAGDVAGNGAFTQNAQMVNLTGANSNGIVPIGFGTSLRLGVMAGNSGAYTLNGGTNNYGNGAFNIGELGSAALTISGGLITGTGNLAVNNGQVGTPVAVNATLGGGLTYGDFTWFEQGYYAPNTGAGLPPHGTTITSMSQADHSFTLPSSYTANNAAQVSVNESNAAISVTAPVPCSGLSFLCTSGNGQTLVNYVVHHADSTTETGSLTIPDWFGPGSANEVLAVGSRVDALGASFQFPGSANGFSGNAPYLWSLDVTLTNTASAVTGVSFTYVSGGVANVMGLSTTTGSGFSPVTIGGFNQDIVMEAGAQNFVASTVTDTVTQSGGAVNVTGGGQLFLGNYGTGVYNLSAGSVDIHSWIGIGRSGGSGTLNMTGGTFNQDGGGNLLVGTGYNAPTGASAAGLINQSGGVINDHSQFLCPENSPSSGTYNLSGTGSLIVNDWCVFGRGGATGVLNMSGGSILQTNSGGNFEVGEGSSGTINQTGGSITTYNEFWIGQGGGALGIDNMGGSATLTVNNWLAIGRQSGNGTLNLTNGVVAKIGNGGNHFTVGSGGQGTINQFGGLITNTTSDFFLGESAGGTWNMEGGEAILGNLLMCVNTSGSAQLNLDGGILQVNQISSTTGASAVSLLNLNGGTLRANGNNAGFINGLYEAAIGAGGVTIDSQNYNLTIPQALVDNGGGPLTKTGSGTLTLTGANSYAGNTIVAGGTLISGTTSYTPGSLTVADGAGFGLTVQSAGSQFTVANLSLGSATGASLSFDMGAFGNPSLSQAPLMIAPSGTFTAKGTITVNIADTLPQLGEFPLIQYQPGGFTGGANFVVGSLPTGVLAVIVTNNANNSIDLNITGVNAPRWDGEAGGTWDLGSDTNWVNIGTGMPTVYTDPSAVVFDDNALGSTNVNLTATVNPLGITVANNVLNYNIVGTGKISGTYGLTKQGTGSLALLNSGGNNYTGPTVINAGTVVVTNLANGGSPSAIGASSASPTNLVLNGGDLTYSGPAAAVNRSYITTATNSGITVTGNLTLSNQVTAAQAGGLYKTGLAQLSYTASGSNVLAGSSSLGYTVNDGGVVFDGSNGGQTNSVGGNHLGVDGVTSTAQVLITNAVMNLAGNMDVGDQAGTAGAATLDGSNSVLNVGSWMILGDGANATASFTMNNGTLNVQNGRLFLGSSPGTMTTFNMNGGTINKAGDYFAIVNGGWNGTGARTGVVNQVSGTINSSSECWIGDGGGAGNQSLGIYNLSGGSLTVNNWFGIGRDGSTGIFNMTGGTLNKGVNGDMVIGRGGSSGTFTMSGGTLNKDNVNPLIVGQGQGVGELDQSGGTITTTGEYWLGVDNGTIATNNISGTAQMNVHNWVTIGRNGHGVVNMSAGQFNADTQPFIVGIWGGSDGIWNQSGGSLYVNQDIWIGQGDVNAHGMINLSGGTITNTGWIAIGREGAQGVLNISGGTMVKAGVGNNISIAHNGGASGVVNISGTGSFICLSGETWVGENGAPGTWNMNGGTATLLTVHLAQNADAQGLMTLNGGTLTANEISTGNTGASQRELDFNGGTLRAGTSNPNFIHDLTAANVQAGGAVIDTAGYEVWVPQPLIDTGAGGGLTKVGNGTLNLNGVNTYTGATAVHAGLLGGVGSIAGPVTVASGAALGAGAGSIGTLTISNTLTFAAGSTSLMKVNLSTNDQIAGLTGVAYAGSLVVSNTSGGPLLAGATYKLFNSAVGGTGNFTSVTILPAGAGTFNPATGVLTITTGGALQFNPVKLSAGNLILTGSGGSAGEGYTVLSTTNLTTAMSGWVTNTVGTMDGTGSFSNAIPVNPLQPAQFFRVRTP